MSDRSSVQLWAACSAAFACGAAAGAYALHYYYSTTAAAQPKVTTIDLSQLQGLPVPSGGGLSPTASVSSYSLAPTPRLSCSGSVSGNGISRQASRGSSSGGDAG